ncbi:hypothetical protein scyTo_0003995 [Scyliorhinus torazame]|uniref:SH2 domain-containing protein n=1 Tax=Scyliorhinus torazame TaxID=75743 RepID=A0A401NIR0_SCYTO|nr:hypothetical protein [Scyliorhinus torazame]
MLQQILETMCIEPELLAELNEEQKQILFFKMRQEQIRRWKEREEKLEPKEREPPTKNGKSVNWLLAADSDVWVWVMGEGPGDKPYDHVCDEIIAERARQQAQKEAGELREPSKRLLSTKIVGGYVVFAQEHVEVKEEEERKTQEEEIKRLEEARTQQLYINLKEAQEMVQRNEKEDPEWRESLRKSKAADERRRSIAKQARADYKRHSLKAIERGKVCAMTQNFQSSQPLVKPTVVQRKNAIHRKEENMRKDVRTQKSSDTGQEKIIRWFREQQMPLRAGYEKDCDLIAPWFHGVITRQETEELLSKKGAGAFLIRISERIIGYCLSYRSSDGFKHFLIDTSKDSYTFFGVDQLQHATLVDLVDYHKEEPITLAGAELLLEPCGQFKDPPDYAHLFN